MTLDWWIGLVVWMVSWMFVFYVVAMSGTYTWDDLKEHWRQKDLQRRSRRDTPRTR